jgi:glycosyltransferase involved in cell wall biosynthesis
MNILVLEPYFGGSHKAFLGDLDKHLPYSFHILSLPARKWKWRMRLAAPYYAELLRSEHKGLLAKADLILCSTFVDVAALRSLLPADFRSIPILTYFHENQFAYPVQVYDERDFHYPLTNFTTAMASDRLAFNSLYNLDSFLEGCRSFFKKMPDMKISDYEEIIRKKSTILHPAMDFSQPDSCLPDNRKSEAPVIVWNHRWEHDKNPEFFFKALYRLQDRGEQFRLIVLGQAFARQPAIFAEAKTKLADKIDHFGYATDRAKYLRLLHCGDIVVSTALHEFYGIAVIEAVRCGCRPLLPNRLSYPELFGDEFLYEDENFIGQLVGLLQKSRLKSNEVASMTDRFSWSSLLPLYRQWFEGST